ncbi:MULTISPECIES: zf-TFIIB domain-containing protein [Brevundimonas]|uniref:TFIIB-type zinc ribbon-containing protein n=1 Tax=Brevundimonas TaxID=41275 RepID=UPI000F030F88|nr:zf-TFIIB domain-containing protein [Brevundimonas lutea]
MPLLMCPNDSASMTTVERSGVQFDMCPQCRGVWLDRGELEKLMAASQQEALASAPPPAQPAYAPPPQQPYPPQQAPQPWGRDSRGYDDRRRYDDDDYKRHKYKKKPSIFDIFD